MRFALFPYSQELALIFRKGDIQMGKRYSENEDSILRKYWFTEGSKGCHRRLPDRTEGSIRARASYLNIKGSREQIERRNRD